MKQMLMNLFSVPEREGGKVARDQLPPIVAEAIAMFDGTLARERAAAVIEFDGGTSCNRPALGYGNGYGSFRVNDGDVHRLAFGPMSSNAAEIFTLAAAIGRARSMGATALLLCGDSRI